MMKGVVSFVLLRAISIISEAVCLVWKRLQHSTSWKISPGGTKVVYAELLSLLGPT